MNSNLLTKLQPALLDLGDTAHTVVLLRTFLKSHPNIPTADLKINNNYDRATLKAIAYVQKNKGLIPTGRMDPDTWMALGTEANPIQINEFAGNRIVQNLMAAGYFLKNPPAKKAKKVNSVIRTSSAKLSGSDDYWYNFTFRVFVTTFAPFDWFGPFNLSGGDNQAGKERRFGTDPDASYRLQCFSTVTATPGTRTYD